MTLDDAANVSEADAAALEVLRAMKPLEDSEQLVGVLHVEAHAVVPDVDDVLGARNVDRADLDARPLPRARVLQRVPQEVPEHEEQERRIAANGGQTVEDPLDLAAPLLME